MRSSRFASGFIICNAVLLLCAALIPTVCCQAAETYNYTVEIAYAPASLSSGEPKGFTFHPGIDLRFMKRMGRHLRVGLTYSASTIYADSSAGSHWAFGSQLENRIAGYHFNRVSVVGRLSLANESQSFVPAVELAVGREVWNRRLGATSAIDTSVNSRGAPTLFKAEELVISPGFFVQLRTAERFGAGLGVAATYFTGKGAEFSDSINSTRPRWGYALRVGFQIFLDRTLKPDHWPAERAWQNAPASSSRVNDEKRDSDDDGVSDQRDKCPATPHGAKVGSDGCPLDSDLDGVFDGLDDCPETEPTALGLVDIYGCPIDRDFDAVPDYLDKCPTNTPGAVVDAAGCPIDSDKDGVPDGPDNCPNTLAGTKVDLGGCPDVNFFSQTMTLRVAYDPGSFELDAPAEKKLRELATLLLSAPEVQATIVGYTDDEGSSEENRLLSDKRAKRVRDFLIRMGVTTDRLKALGRGETNPVSSNSTPEGRTKNRRVEISFKK